ncbi:MAG: hypothetical protein LAT83_11780 [Kiritimatiellae bacterium]|nr:hypothetical protein [Kiritimatiellia bacterium]
MNKSINKKFIKKHWTWVASAFTVFTIAAASKIIPIRHGIPEDLVFGLVYFLALSIGGFFTYFIISARSEDPTVRNRSISRSVACALMAMVLISSVVTRQSAVKSMLPEIDGVLIEKYRSHDHGLSSIIVKTSRDGLLGAVQKKTRTVNGTLYLPDGHYAYEGVDYNTWQMLEPGDVLKKEVGNPFILVNGEKYIYTWPGSWRMFPRSFFREKQILLDQK